MKATPNIKSRFFADLQSVVSDVPSSDILLVLGHGDFKARVGSLLSRADKPGRFDVFAGDELA